MKLKGFLVSNGLEQKKNNYYVEWRNYAGSDTALNMRVVQYLIQEWLYGMRIKAYTDNWVGVHPGEGFLRSS